MESKKTEIYRQCIKSIFSFMKKEGYVSGELPKVILDNKDYGDSIFIRTAFYDPNKKTIHLFIHNALYKDRLRSFCHECIHFMQDKEGRLGKDSYSGDRIVDDEKLIKLEKEAYLKGNIAFRSWTETMQSNIKNGNFDKYLNALKDKYGYKILSESFKNNNKESLNESIFSEKIEPEDINLSSFKIKHELNPKFWDEEGHLDSRVRMKLLDIADEFMDFIGIDWVKKEDIVLTGSLANYNWSKKYSDIDLHILVNYSEIDDKPELVDNYLYSQKTLWNKEHEDLKIFGFPIECNVENAESDDHVESGVYSLEKDEWVEKPKRSHLANYKNKPRKIKERIAKYIDRIDTLVEKYNEAEGDKHKINKVGTEAKNIWNLLTHERKKGFAKSPNEMNDGNIVFKALRRRGYVEKLSNLQTKIYNKVNSLA